MIEGRDSRRGWWILLPLLGISAWLALFGDRQVMSPAADKMGASARSDARPRALGPAAPLRTSGPIAPEPIEAVARRQDWITESAVGKGSTRRDLFAARSWSPPSPIAVEPSAAAAAPPVPFSFLGKKLEGDVWEVYLSRGEQTYIVREGQTLEGAYRIEKIAPPTMTLTYVPLSELQALGIGDAR